MGRRRGAGSERTAKRVSRGTIQRLVPDRGFGFIQADGEKQSLFFHRTSVEKVAFEDLKEGDFVEFEVQRDQRRDRNHAVNIRPAERPEPSAAPQPQSRPRPRPALGRIYTGWQADAIRAERSELYRRRSTSGLDSSDASRSSR
ncbi:MAG: cold shock domain-containing protein [Chloroflexi bacterium]|nr:cold shock domain-containing protein [Chloroflexota bacterium]MDA8189467.1 cold shock domain-containing protein [Dehalococcoidales bacterium]